MTDPRRVDVELQLAGLARHLQVATGPGAGWLWVGRGTPSVPVKLAICWGVHQQMYFADEPDGVNAAAWHRFVVFAVWRHRRVWWLWRGRRHLVPPGGWPAQFRATGAPD